MVSATRTRPIVAPASGGLDAGTLPRTEGALAVDLLAAVRTAGPKGWIHIAGTEGRAERLARLLWRLDPEIGAFLLPPWDCLPFDRASPSPRVMGLRVATLSALAEGPDRPWIVLGTAEALVQRVPPKSLWRDAAVAVAAGASVDLEDVGRSLASLGYAAAERVDTTGEYAIRGAVIDVFPAGYDLPVRIEHEGGRVAKIASYDPDSQRTTDAFETLRLRPVSEVISLSGEARPSGVEHRLPDVYDGLETLLSYAPQARVTVEPGATDRESAFFRQVRDAYESRLHYDRGGQRPLSPDRLYLSEAARRSQEKGRAVLRLDDAPADPEPEIPRFALASKPWGALREFAAAERKAGRRIVLAGPDERDLHAIAGRIDRPGGAAATVETWDACTAASPGSVLSYALPLAAGFRSADGVTVIATADVLGSRAGTRAGEVPGARPVDLEGDRETFRIGDAVIHLDHGLGRLAGLETVEAGPTGPTDTIRIGYAGDATLLVPTSDVSLMWRYGSGTDGLHLDRLGGESWPKRRAKVEAEIAEAAAALATLADERGRAEAVRISPPRRDYERFVAGFAFNETADQHAAIEDILRDLRSTRAMDRLVCGDVGFGKTEVALRAAAAVALSGRQVAVAAPTTVLVRQHLETFRTRFAPFGIEVANLSRLARPAELRAAKDGIASGAIRIVVGTHALAGRGTAFADLGLLVVDEEQRFGTADKEKLRHLGRGVHVLTLTATPIPRTLQAALAGLQDISVLATPPAERLPVRTFVSELDEPTLREALLREHRRGGQSFVVCPRVEDIAPMADRLKRIAPELETLVAHGKLKVETIDDTMIRFADGDGDVLLATNIVESGLDVPRANTMVVWHADRFGLAQLHQLRGRVGRGRARGVAYLLTDPEVELSDDTTKRLRHLADTERLGAGFEISAADLESRGAGDLVGDSQAGHVKLIGAGLYRRLLERALLIARGQEPPDEWLPEINIGMSGQIPADYVPEPEVRLNLYARIAAVVDEADETRVADEIDDRFGSPPPAVADAIALSRLTRLCRRADVARLDAGPQGLALTFKSGQPTPARVQVVAELCGEPVWKDGRLIIRRAIPDGERVALAEEVLRALGGR